MVVYFRKMNNLFMLLGGIAGAALGFCALKGKILVSGDISRIFFFVIFLIAGVVAGRAAAAFTANKRLRDIYAVLYRDCDPARFIVQFGPLLETVPKNMAEYMDGCCRLSFAHEALGEFEGAYAMISDLKPEELRLHALTTTSLLTNQKTNLRVLMGDAEGARALMDDLTALKESASKRAATLAQNLGECIRLHSTRLDAMAGSADTDTGYLEEEINAATNLIHKKEMQLELARFLMGQGEQDRARQILEDILKDRRGLHSEKLAQELLG